MTPGRGAARAIVMTAMAVGEACRGTNSSSPDMLGIVADEPGGAGETREQSMPRISVIVIVLALATAAGCQSAPPTGGPHHDRQGCISPRAQSNGYCNR